METVLLFLKYYKSFFFVGNQPDHQYFLYGESREKGNVMVVNGSGYLGPICDENWDIEEVKLKIQQTKIAVTKI
jgi:hypothetical protein